MVRDVFNDGQPEVGHKSPNTLVCRATGLEWAGLFAGLVSEPVGSLVGWVGLVWLVGLAVSLVLVYIVGSFS